MSRKGENIYKRKDGRWEGRYPKGRKPNGTIHYGYVYRPTYKECKEAVIKLRVHYQLPMKEISTYQGTVTAWLEEWLIQQQTLLRPSTVASYSHKIKKYVLPHIGSLPLAKLDKVQLQGLVTSWQQASLSVTTIQTISRILRRALDNAVEQGKLVASPWQRIQLPKQEKKPVRALTQKEQKQLIQSAKADKLGLAVLLALYTGLRIGELSALRWQDIDFSEKTITIRHTYQRIPQAIGNHRTILNVGQVKSTASKRTIPLANALVPLLKKAYQAHQSEYVFSVGSRPMEPRLLTYHFHRIRKRAGLETIHFHQLRHTFATRCLEARGDVASISALLGHSSTKMTLDVYTDTVFEQRIITIQKMSRLLQ